MIKKTAVAAGLAFGLCAGAHADILGLRLSAYQWHPDIQGTIKSGESSIDLEDDLGFDDDRYSAVALAFEHPVPLLPNVMLAHTEISTSANSTLGSPIEFEGSVYLPSQGVRSELDLSHTDLTLYYELLDNVVSLDAGLTVRRFEEGVSISSASASEELELDETLPLLYLSARADLPLTGLYAGADLNTVRYSDNELADWRAYVGYLTNIGLGLELGMRSFDLQYDDNDEEADVEIRGAYGSLLFRF